METLYRRCAGLDVHKDSVVACVRLLANDGALHQQVRTFGTMTGDLCDLAEWLVEHQVSHAAMEATGVYWKPVWNLLEPHLTVWVVNAQHIKQVPGRKTDVKDCAWIAQLLQHGLLRPSFVPPKSQRDLRELTRQRSQLKGQKASVANRIQKVLEDANIKLGSVASDVLGVSGRAMLRAMANGESDPFVLAEMARKRLREKIPQLQEALQGTGETHHRFLIGLLLDQVEQIEGLIERVTGRIGEVLREDPFEGALELLQTIPGIDVTAAQGLVAEIGPNVEAFGSAAQLASWAGMCPGNNESAGKRRSGRTRRGSRWLRALLVQVAWAASRTKGTYLASQYRRLAARRGRKRALVAVGHTLVVIVYHVLKKRSGYRELGADYLDQLDGKRLTRYHQGRLERLGYRVTLEAQEEARATD